MASFPINMTLLAKQEGLVGQVGGTGSGRGLRVAVFARRCAGAGPSRESGSMVAEWYTTLGIYSTRGVPLLRSIERAMCPLY